MSLPVRLKLNPSKRPSIDHIRSQSLSSNNESAKLINTKMSSDKDYKDYEKESEKAMVSRIGARKRLTKEQKKFCYSEPEKLDHLGVNNATFAWKSEGLSKNQSGGHRRMKSLDKERTLSSSNISKTELKQIQHNALVEYMERKANQRPSSVYQSHGQKTSGTQSSLEWKCITNETKCNSDGSPKYYHRRSTGASSSYDATVTWNDRHLKMLIHGEKSAVTTMINTTSVQCTVENSNDSISGCQENNDPLQIPVGQTSFSTSSLHSNVMVSKNRSSITVDNTVSETGKVFIARSRGKSMEELGIPDIIRLSVLSQSSDHIYHIKGSTLVPQPETSIGAAVLHQDKLKAGAEKESRKEPRQISKGDFLGPQSSDVAKTAQEKHSRSQKASVVLSNRDNSSSSLSSQLHPTAVELSPCLQGEDEVFSQPISTENAFRSNRQQEDNWQYTVEDITISHNVLPGHLHTEQQVMNNTHILSLQPSEEHFPGYDNEVRADVNDLSKGSTVGELSVHTPANQDIEATHEQKTSSDVQSVCNKQPKELETDPSNQGNSSELDNYFSGYKEHCQSDEATDQGMEPNVLEKDFVSKTITGVTTKSPTEEKYALLVKEILSKDKSLMDILKPVPVRESAIGLMKSLFHVDISILEKCRNQRLKKDKVNVESMSKSHSKTMLLLQRTSEECLDEITSKKVELISNINAQLEELFAQRKILLSEISENSTHGSNLETVVKEICKPNEYERYKMFIGDLEKVVSLLFSLTTRLAKVENALTRTDENTDAEEMLSLKERHGLLCRQREDAKDLKDNLDRREQVVTGILAKYLSEAQLEDYKHYVRLKTSFLIEQKDLDEKIKFHEEQLESLHHSISF